ncbi:putative transketolase N-terminal section [Propionispora sp. 2/2-37]|uniref:transketolase n=1 Tax=Propionispora sp. 2/2-37 TaxID=1677858 RepID=UPI0006BB811C|nr:transketolase [Propionispora sp. 2/2-37]CUH97777.1 putative transketolase N-terminal section [Propionispora sp. 2/2-37]
MNIAALKKTARQVRIDIINMLQATGTGHPGGALSMVELLTVLYFEKMNINPREPKWQDRDRFILSKGHAAPGLYAILAARGFFPKSELSTLRKFKSILQGHPDMKVTPGVDMSSGSLGQGLSVANGMALSGKLDHKGYRVYVLLGDGELQEGQVWESVMSAAHYKLDNLTVFVDCNGLQINGSNEEVMGVQPVAGKFAAFGWNVLEIDGHNMPDIAEAIDAAMACKEKPTVIVAKTVKGKGVSFMENQVSWHGAVPNQEQTAQAIAELERGLGI